MPSKTIEKKDIPPAVLDSLYENFCLASRGFGGIRSGGDAKRLYFIAPILLHVVTLFESRDDTGSTQNIMLLVGRRESD